MLNKDAGFQSATSLKTKLLYKYFSKPFSKFLEQVLNRTPPRGCCGIKILKFLFLNVLSFVKKPWKIRKCLREILDIYVSYLFTILFIVVYLIPAVRWRLKSGLKFKCSSNILRIYWFLVNLTKVMKYDTRMHNIRQIIEVKVHVSPKATKSRFQPSKRTLDNHSRWWKSIAKKLLFFIFFITGKLFHYIRQKWICWVSQNTNRYRWFSFNDNFTTIGHYAFSKNCIWCRIWQYMCIMHASLPFYHHVKKAVVLICCCLNIESVFSFSIDKVTWIKWWPFNSYMRHSG